jgi:hydrogenase nickel incorporation protein HypA/HybF
VHELSIASAIVNTAVKHAAGRRVTVVTVRTGRLRQVVPATLEFYWGVVARDSLCEGSRLEQVVVPARIRCDLCATEWEPEFADFRCAACASTTTTIVAGDELEVESIEVEEEEVPACTA